MMCDSAVSNNSDTHDEDYVENFAQGGNISSDNEDIDKIQCPTSQPEDCHGWLGCSPIFDDFFQHLWPYIGNNTANVVFQMVKRLWLIRIDQ
ncbi:hypothetical protein TNCV_4156081 [Trichonephila clavipes]|nr:hypothetical protein TNCV_4156081 [Trichonephila clavipes]